MMKIGQGVGVLELKNVQLEMVFELEETNKDNIGKNVNSELWILNWGKELAPVVVIRELAYKKELKVRPISIASQFLRKLESGNKWLLGLEFDDFEVVGGKPTLNSVSLLQPNIEAKLYIVEEYIDKVIEESCVASFDINSSMVNYDIPLKVDINTKGGELYE